LLYKHREEKHSNRCLFLYFVAGDCRLRGNNRNFRGSKSQGSLPNANVRSEIKDLEQVRKKRQKKADRISYTKNRGSKSRKFGKNGKKGGKAKK